VTTAVRVDECLSIREGHLWLEECDVTELARRFGTPVYVVSEDQLRRNARRIGAAFAAGWPDGETALLPSLKANLSLALRAILNDEGLGADTFGPGELHAALAAGTEPGLISVNGSVKDAELVGRYPFENVWGLLVDEDINSPLPPSERHVTVGFRCAYDR